MDGGRRAEGGSEGRQKMEVRRLGCEAESVDRVAHSPWRTGAKREFLIRQLPSPIFQLPAVGRNTAGLKTGQSGCFMSVTNREPFGRSGALASAADMSGGDMSAAAVSSAGISSAGLGGAEISGERQFAATPATPARWGWVAGVWLGVAVKGSSPIIGNS